METGYFQNIPQLAEAQIQGECTGRSAPPPLRQRIKGEKSKNKEERAEKNMR